AQNRTQKKDIHEFKPEIPEIKKSAWEILPARYRNLNHRAITAAALRPALAPPRLPGNPSGYFLSLPFSHDPEYRIGVCETALTPTLSAAAPTHLRRQQ